jgi:hypothetical protein
MASRAPSGTPSTRATSLRRDIEAISIEPTRVYDMEDARVFLTDKIDVDTIAPQVGGKFMSGFIRAVKPKPQAK